jgi:3-dehydroquinate synthase
MLHCVGGKKLQSLNVQCAPPYSVLIGSDIVKEIPRYFDLVKYSGGCIVCDAAVNQVYGDLIQTSMPPGFQFIMAPGGETAKNLDTLSFLWGAFLKAGLDRKGVVVTFGGGATLDVTGFAASTYMRGVSFIHVPTTLLSQVDASIGGKTGLNIHGVKNLVGAFQQPSGVCIDAEFIPSLSDREIRSGVAEMIKHGMMFSKEHFEELKGISWLQVRQALPQLSRVIYNSCQIKARVVAADPYEGGLRKALNFGHTVGHAIEILSHEIGEPLTHGEAVALGMRAETAMAVKAKLCGLEALNRLVALIDFVGLPIVWKTTVSSSAIAGRMGTDKKNVRGKILFSVPTEVGKLEIDREFSESAFSYGLSEIIGA